MPTATFVESITCFDKSGRFDAEAQRKHFRRLAAAGIGGYVGSAEAGDALVLQPDEYDALLRVAKEELKGKVPFRVASYDGHTARQMIEFYRRASAFAPDALQVCSIDPGHGGLRSPQAGDYRTLDLYFHELLPELKLPCYLSSNALMGYLIPVPLVKKLAQEFPQIAGINVTHPNIHYVTEIIEEVGDKVQVYVTGANQALACLAEGGSGFITAEANIVPELALSAMRNYEQRKMDEAFTQIGQLATIAAECNRTAGVKTALEVLGLIPCGDSRKPRFPATAEEKKEVEAWVKRLGVRELV